MIYETVAPTTTRFSPESKAEDIVEVNFQDDLKIWDRRRWKRGKQGMFRDKK
jgi:hypothetical protein